MEGNHYPLSCRINTLMIQNTKDFLIPGIDYRRRIWQNFLEFWVLKALQLCTCFGFSTILI